jgi:flagellar biosynthesis protein FlhG
MRDASQVTHMTGVMARRNTRVIAVTSGKGGVGKTNVAANLAIAMAQAGENVMLFDADLGLANVDVLLGLQPRFNLAHVVRGEADIDCTIVEGPAGLRIIPASSGNRSMLDLPPRSQAAIVQSFSTLASPPDVLIVDTAAGIADGVARFTQAAHHAIVVVCDEPSSITDSYALIKLFSRDYGISHFHIVTNMTSGPADGRRLFDKLNTVSNQFLDVVLRHSGNIPHDTYLRKAVQEQRAVVDAYPRSFSGRAFRQLAEVVQRLPARAQARGTIEFFFERLIKQEPTSQGVAP